MSVLCTITHLLLVKNYYSYHIQVSTSAHFLYVKNNQAPELAIFHYYQVFLLTRVGQSCTVSVLSVAKTDGFQNTLVNEGTLN